MTTTPTPWIVALWPDAKGNIVIRKSPELARPIATVYAQEDADLIVRAVNAHEVLVEALVRALPFIEMLIDDPAYKSGAVKLRIKEMRYALKLALPDAR